MASAKTSMEIKLKLSKNGKELLDTLKGIQKNGILKHPKVSIILTTCGRWELFEEAIKSVISQDYEDWEMLVMVDERRADERVSFGCCISDDDERIQIVGVDIKEDSSVKRVSVLVNEGLDLARGEYVTYLCDDDVWLPGRLSHMMAAVDQGAEWVVDRVQWIDKLGRGSTHESIGEFLYGRPLEEGHEDLAIHLSPMGVNWICHDCSLHKNGPQRWMDDIKHHTPVDWRFWCSLYRDGLRPVLLDNVGAEAFTPGAWRSGMTMKQALSARRKDGSEMSNDSTVIQYAVNRGGQKECIPQSNGKTLELTPGGRVEMSKVMTPDGQMFPAFVAEGNIRVPRMAKPTPLSRTRELATSSSDIAPAPEIEGPLLTEEKPTEKLPFRRTETSLKKKSVHKKAKKPVLKKVEKVARRVGLKKSKSPTEDSLKRMFKSDYLIK